VKKVRIRENAWVARIAAKKLRFSYVAIVIGHTIYLHNTTITHFVSIRRWTTHELKHVEQYEEHGFLGFLIKYFIEYLKNGYYNNRFEIEARAAENDERLLKKYSIFTNPGE
jgi:hypothetical protein